MSDFQQLAQTLAVSLKAVQMYTAAHPRAQESLGASHMLLSRWLQAQDRIQFVVSGTRAFLDGQPQEARTPHTTALIRQVSERGVGGFIFERGLSAQELLVFLQGLGVKPARLEEVGGFDAFLKESGVLRIKVTQTRYREITEGEAQGAADVAPALNPAPTPGGAPNAGPTPQIPSSGGGAGQVRGQAAGSAPGTARAATSADLAALVRESMRATRGQAFPTPGGIAQAAAEDDLLGFLEDFQPADLSGLAPMGEGLGLGDGLPTPIQMSVLNHTLSGLSPELLLGFLAGIDTLPDHPAGLAKGVEALSVDLFVQAATAALAQGAPWQALSGPLQTILRSRANREAMVQALAGHLRSHGFDQGQAEALIRQLDWDALSIEARVLKVLQEGYLFELSLEQLMAFLRDLLELRRFDEFTRIVDALLEALQSEWTEIRTKAAQSLSGVARWADEPGLPHGVEAAMAESLRAHFAWEPDPLIHRHTTDALDSLLVALIPRGQLALVIRDLRELEGLCSLTGDGEAWRKESMSRLRQALARPDVLDAALFRAFDPNRQRVLDEVLPFFDFLGAPMARHLVLRLGEEADRTRRGRIVEALRHMGPLAMPSLLEALRSTQWYLVRNALMLLSELGDAGVLEQVVPQLRHPEPRVRRTAVRALWKLGGPTAEPHLLECIRETDAETLQEILFALGQLRSVASLPAVTTLAQDKRVHEKLRVQCLDTLGLIGAPASLPVLLECTKRKGFFGGGEAPAIRQAAVKALAALGTAEALAALKRVLAGEPAGEERETLRRLAGLP